MSSFFETEKKASRFGSSRAREETVPTSSSIVSTPVRQQESVQPQQRLLQPVHQKTTSPNDSKAKGQLQKNQQLSLSEKDKEEHFYLLDSDEDDQWDENPPVTRKLDNYSSDDSYDIPDLSANLFSNIQGLATSDDDTEYFDDTKRAAPGTSDDSIILSEESRQNDDSNDEISSTDEISSVNNDSEEDNRKKVTFDFEAELRKKQRLSVEKKDQQNEVRKKSSTSNLVSFGQSEEVSLTCEKIDKIMRMLSETIDNVTNVQDDNKLATLMTFNNLLENDAIISITPEFLRIVFENRQIAEKIARLS